MNRAAVAAMPFASSADSFITMSFMLPIRIEATEKSIIARNIVNAADEAITFFLSYSSSSPVPYC